MNNRDVSSHTIPRVFPNKQILNSVIWIEEIALSQQPGSLSAR